jgi:Protein of Unknown function (DUF2784)
MLARCAADGVLLFHAAFILFAVFGAAFALKYRWMALVHLPCALWAALVVGFGWVCPLTPLEQTLRRAAGQAGYSGSFVEHYVLSAIYPPGLTRNVQIALAIAVVAVNVILYWRVWRQRAHKTERRST